jgi:hypothetical protein
MEYTTKQLCDLSYKVYGAQDDRLYDLEDIFYYHQKWTLRYVNDNKHGRSKESEKKLLVSLAWYFAIINRFQIDLQKILEKRYPCKCPFCMEIPCCCQDLEKRKAQKTGRPVFGKPDNIIGWQELMTKIYPAKAEFSKLEMLLAQDKFHQAFRQFRQISGKRGLREIEIACADYFVELLKTANNLDIDLANEYVLLMGNGCLVCEKTPCECFYRE